MESEEEREKRLSALHKTETELAKGKRRPKIHMWKTAVSEEEARAIKRKE